jgi:hypothetical protein
MDWTAFPDGSEPTVRSDPAPGPDHRHRESALNTAGMDISTTGNVMLAHARVRAVAAGAGCAFEPHRSSQMPAAVFQA